MGHADLIFNGALSALLLFGGPPTTSPSLRPVESLYDQDAQRVKHLSDRAESIRRVAFLRRQHLSGGQTDDAGAKLCPRQYVSFLGTGDLIEESHLTPWRSSYPGEVIHAPAEIASAPPAHVDAVWWIQQATGLSEASVAVLLNVERLTVRNWKAGKPIKELGLRRLMETRDVLRRAQRWHPQPEELVAWLHSPDPDDGISPARLLSQGEFDRARLLAVLAPTTVEPTPVWVRRPVPEAWQDALREPVRPGEFVEDSS